MGLIKLNEVYENWIEGDGVFSDLASFDVPWANEEDENLVANLNMAYHGSHSGDKNISPIIYKFLKSEDENTREKLARIIFTMYSDKWLHLWDLMKLEYNPIENYNMTEHETTDDTTTHSGSDTTVKTGSDTLEMTGTDTIAHTGDTENKVSAFNSSDYVDRSKDIIDTSDEETRNMTDETTYNTTSEITHDTEDVLDGERDLTRSGNIGVTTSQQMAQSEIELRKWLYYESVFNDIDNVLTLSIY